MSSLDDAIVYKKHKFPGEDRRRTIGRVRHVAQVLGDSFRVRFHLLVELEDGSLESHLSDDVSLKP